MKMTKRQLVLLLNGLVAGQEMAHAAVPSSPTASAFTKYDEATQMLFAVLKGSNTVSFGEVDDLFTIVTEMLSSSLDGEEETEIDLADLPPTEYIQ